MTPDDLTSPVHFAPYGGTNAICGETVPRSVGVFPDTGEYDDARFTVRRGKATCRECLCRTRRTASPDDLTSRAQGEAERLRPVTGVADDTERRGNLLWGAGYVTGATWAAAQAPSVEALTAEVERLVGLSQSNASAFERAYDAMSAAQAQLDRLQAGIENAIRDARDIYAGTGTADPRQVIDAIEELVAQADRHALLAEDET